MRAHCSSQYRAWAFGMLCLAVTLFTPALADTPNSGLIDLGTPAAENAFPTPIGGCINQSGAIIGEAGVLIDGIPGHHAFLYSGGAMTDIAPPWGDSLSTPVALNDLGQVLALSIGPNGEISFLYDHGHWYPILPFFDGAQTVGTGMNSRGQVIGTTPVPEGDRGFLWDRTHGARDIGTLYHDKAHHGHFLGSSAASALNDDGFVAGWAYTGDRDSFNFPIYHAIVYDGTIHDLGTLSPDHGRQHFLSTATGMNQSGQVIGTSQTSQVDDFDVPLTHAFVWDAHKGMTDLGTLNPDPKHKNRFLGGSTPIAINNVGQIIGVADTALPADFGSVQHAFLWTPGGKDGIEGNRQMKDLGVLPGGTGSVSVGLNDRGDVIGMSDTFTPDVNFSFQHAFLYSGHAMIDITPEFGDPFGQFTSTPVSINSRGQVVGFYDTEDFKIHPFLYDQGVFTDLGTLGGGTSFADGINDTGQIAGASTLIPNSQLFHPWKTGPIGN